MNALEIAILLLAALGAIRGWRGGIVRSALSLISTLAALWVAGQMSPTLGEMIHRTSGLSSAGSGWLAFLVLFLMLVAVASLIIATISLIGKIMPDSSLGAFAGSLLGLYNATMIGALLVVAVPAIAGSKWNPDPPNGWISDFVQSVANPVIEQIVPLRPGVAGELI